VGKLNALLIALYLALAVVSCGAVTAPTRVQAATFTYELSVSESSPTWVFGQPSPSFRASLIPPSDDPPLTGNTSYYIKVGSTSYVGSSSSMPPRELLYLAGIGSTALAPGQYPVVAEYLSPNHGWLTSAPITLTVVKATPDLQCQVSSTIYVHPPNAPLTISANPGLAGGTFTVSFTGPRTFTSAPAQADSSGHFAITTPPAPGVYQVSCNFSGSATQSAGSAPLYSRQITISASNAIAGVTVFTDPAPLTSFVPTTYQVIVAGRPGLPPPTGTIGLTIDTYFTKLDIALGSDGKATFQATNPPIPSSASLQVLYTGDTVYATSVVSLSQKTAPIPHPGGSSNLGTAPITPSSGNANAGTVPGMSNPTPSPTQGDVTPTPTATSRASGSRSNSDLAKTAAGAPNGPPGPLPYIVALLVGLVALTGMGSRMAIRRRRRRNIKSTPSP
jgi:hypothetical protein